MSYYERKSAVYEEIAATYRARGDERHAAEAEEVARAAGAKCSMRQDTRSGRMSDTPGPYPGSSMATPER